MLIISLFITEFAAGSKIGVRTLSSFAENQSVSNDDGRLAQMASFFTINA